MTPDDTRRTLQVLAEVDRRIGEQVSRESALMLAEQVMKLRAELHRARQAADVPAQGPTGRRRAGNPVRRAAARVRRAARDARGTAS